jgi:hypothetical protein
MTWEQLVIPVLLLLVLLVQRLRMRKGTVEEAQGDEAKATRVPVAMKKQVPVRDSRKPSEAPRIVQPATGASPAAPRWQPRVSATARYMRRGIVLMTVLGPCRGLERSVQPGE